MENFSSQATSPQGVMEDYVRWLSYRRGASGRVPATTGVTRRVQPMMNFDGVSQQFRDLTAIQRQSRGGFVNDDPLQPSQYLRDRMKFMEASEGRRLRAYDDQTGRNVKDGEATKGFVSVGIGFNMDAPDSRLIWEDTFGDKLSFDDVYAGKIKMSDSQVDTLFNSSAVRTEDFLNKAFKGTDLASHQRLGLFSMAYQNKNLIGPALAQAVKDGDMKAATDEILVRSNRQQDQRLLPRRYREAAMFNGDGNDLPSFAQYQTTMRERWGGKGDAHAPFHNQTMAQTPVEQTANPSLTPGAVEIEGLVPLGPENLD